METHRGRYKLRTANHGVNMKNFAKQRGMTMWGLLFLIVIFGFFIYILITLWPVYYQQFKVQQALQNIKVEASDGMSALEIRKKLSTKFSIDDIDIVSTKEVRIENTAEGRLLIAEAEIVKPLFGNISILITVYESVELP